MELFYYRHSANRAHSGITPKAIGFFEITAVFDGCLEYTVDGKECPVSKGDIIFIKKGSVRARRPFASANYVSLNFYADTVSDFPVLMSGAVSDTVYALLLAMDGIFRYTRNTNDERLALLLECLVKQLLVQLRHEAEDPLVSKIKLYIKDNLAEPISLKKISAAVFFSQAHCEKLFKEETGKSIINYLLDERLESAKMLIREGSLSLSDIAAETGFADYNYFSRVFKKRVGVSPMSYKKSVLSFK